MATGDQKTENLQTDKTSVQKAKQDATDRLSKALRDNLRRRKAQAKARKTTANTNAVDQSKKYRM